jgi:hypothetical protein
VAGFVLGTAFLHAHEQHSSADLAALIAHTLPARFEKIPQTFRHRRATGWRPAAKLALPKHDSFSAWLPFLNRSLFGNS